MNANLRTYGSRQLKLSRHETTRSQRMRKLKSRISKEMRQPRESRMELNGIRDFLEPSMEAQAALRKAKKIWTGF